MKEKAAGLFALSVLVLAGAPSGALAQQDLAAARACTSISTDSERLACYDRAFRKRSESIPPPRATSTPAAPTESIAGASTESTPAASTESKPAPSAESKPAPHSEPAVTARNKPTNRRESRRQRKAARARADAENKGVEITVAKVERIRGSATLVTDDGKVWRQTGVRQVIFPPTPFRAVVSAGFLGNYFLSVPGKGVSISVAQGPR